MEYLQIRASQPYTVNISLATVCSYLSFAFADSRGLVEVSAGVKVEWTAFFHAATVGNANVHQLTLPMFTQTNTTIQYDMIEEFNVD